MCKKFKFLIEPSCKKNNLSIQDNVCLALRAIVPSTAIICAPDTRDKGRITWGVIYSNGADTLVHLLEDNKVHIEGHNEDEIAILMQSHLDRM